MTIWVRANDFLKMRKPFQSNLPVDFSQCLSQNKDPFLKKLGTILTGSKESSSGIDQLPVESPSPGPREDSNLMFYMQESTKRRVSLILLMELQGKALLNQTWTPLQKQGRRSAIFIETFLF